MSERNEYVILDGRIHLTTYAVEDESVVMTYCGLVVEGGYQVHGGANNSEWGAEPCTACLMAEVQAHMGERLEEQQRRLQAFRERKYD